VKKKIVIFISGRGSNMIALLNNIKNGILKDLCQVELVFANKPDAAGLKIAEEQGVPTACIESKGKKREVFDQVVIDFLKKYDLDYIVLAGYMRILSPVFISAYRNKIINIHPADTDEFQGVGAYEWAFENKKEFTKITVHFVDEGVDTGPVIGKQVVDLRGCKTLEEVEKIGLATEHAFYSEALRRVFSSEYKLQKGS
jgi:phosphoribosylglycinamide formyltransferase-1